MNNLSNLLNNWKTSNEEVNWVLGTVYKTEGSAYRKAGAHMLINEFGNYYGLLSGGCLESDIVLNARKVMQTKQSKTVVYDSFDEDGIAHKIGVGCGGKVYILLQNVTESNKDVLQRIFSSLKRRVGGVLRQDISSNFMSFVENPTSKPVSSYLEKSGETESLVSFVSVDPHIMIFGGGLDVVPLVNFAKILGWYVSVIDPRPANARLERFPSADFLGKSIDENLLKYARKSGVRGAVIMGHSIKLDSESLLFVQKLELEYIGLLGPKKRFQEIRRLINLKKKDLRNPVLGPAGLNIGGSLPESIALSIISQCHEKFYSLDDEEC
ncbi:MAG: XdhC/CoxI family protein [Burkholderiaceae bacterium]|nr:MAG: XdhC/CoxI family protein [Burkholderiaceae bacterium]